MTSPLTDQQLDDYETLAAHLHEYGYLPIDAEPLTEGVHAFAAEIRRLRKQRTYLLDQIAKKDAASGAGDAALADFLSGKEA